MREGVLPRRAVENTLIENKGSIESYGGRVVDLTCINGTITPVSVWVHRMDQSDKEVTRHFILML